MRFNIITVAVRLTLRAYIFSNIAPVNFCKTSQTPGALFHKYRRAGFGLSYLIALDEFNARQAGINLLGASRELLGERNA